MKTYELKQNLKQQYNNYTSEDFAVWKLLFERQIDLLTNLAAPEYLQAVSEIGFTSDKIPDFNETNAVLLSKTGWSIEVVEGIISEPDFFNLLANKKFPATTWLRKLSELDYLPEPDMFHDVFGHLPLLVNQQFCNFFEVIGQLGIKHIHQPDIVTMLGRLYWFTVEFGLIETSKGLRIYGAGILSSNGESKFAVSDVPQHLKYDPETIMHTAFENDRIQDKYFIITSFDQLYESVEAIKRIIKTESNLAEIN